MSRSRKGITLTELLVIIAVMVVLAATRFQVFAQTQEQVTILDAYIKNQQVRDCPSAAQHRS